MRIPVIAGNWKMNKTALESVAFIKELKDFVRNIEGVNIIVCPPFTSLWPIRELVDGTNIHLGAQNLNKEERGAFTGEISPLMLQDIGCEYVILGHSERRKYFKEASDEIARKAKSAFSHQLIPIVCVGENLAERESGQFKEVIKEEIEALFSEIDLISASRIIIAYEPIWAIGTGKSSNPDDAESVISFIRELFCIHYGEKIAEQIRILYGGSVDPKNIRGFMEKPDIDGALVGGASLQALSFSLIVKAAKLF